MKLLEVFGRMLWLGIVGFGGPPAHLEMMRRMNARLGWVSEAEFTDMIGAANLLPGPSSTEVAAALGYRRAGLVGLLAAGIGFAGPAVAIMWFLGYLVVSYRNQVSLGLLMPFVVPAVAGSIFGSAWNLARSAVKDKWGWLYVAAGAFLPLIGGTEAAILVVAGIVAGNLRPNRSVSGKAGFSLLPLALVMPKLPLLVTFLYAGVAVYGGGNVLISFFQSELVDRRGLLTSGDVALAISLGQMTPGPVFSAATFCGFLIQGHTGALQATLGIFVPAFGFAFLMPRASAWFRKSESRGAALDGINLAAIGLMVSAGIRVMLPTQLEQLPFGLLLLGAAFGYVGLRRGNPAVPIAVSLVLGAILAVPR